MATSRYRLSTNYNHHFKNAAEKSITSDLPDFDESDIVWSSDEANNSTSSTTTTKSKIPTLPFMPIPPFKNFKGTNKAKVVIKKITPPPVKSSSSASAKSSSLPVKIPDWSRFDGRNGRLLKDMEEEDDDDGIECIPPHEYLAMTRGSSASLSVHEGIGRTLKGRDMCRVRNAVWKHVGFED